jgi:cytochrome P450
MRRGALNSFFSTKAVVELEPVVKSKVDLLATRFEAAQKTGEIIRVDAAFMALTMDVICQYAFAKDDNMLLKDDFNLAWKEMIIGAFEGGALLMQFPSMVSIMNAVPDQIVGFMMPSMSLMLEWKAGVRRRVIPILNRTETVSDIENAPHRTIFHELRDSNLPEREKTVDRLRDEGQILSGAGSETTAKALSTATFYLLTDREVLRTLKKELTEVTPEADTWSKLTQLPYLVRGLFAKPLKYKR